MLNQWEDHPNLEGVKQRHFDQDGILVRQIRQDVEPVIDAATRERNETGGWNADRSMKKIASVPATLWYDWVAEWQRKGVLPPHSHPEFSKMANELTRKRVLDGDYGKFRV